MDEAVKECLSAIKAFKQWNYFSPGEPASHYEKVLVDHYTSVVVQKYADKYDVNPKDVAEAVRAQTQKDQQSQEAGDLLP